MMPSICGGSPRPEFLTFSKDGDFNKEAQVLSHLLGEGRHRRGEGSIGNLFTSSTASGPHSPLRKAELSSLSFSLLLKTEEH